MVRTHHDPRAPRGPMRDAVDGLLAGAVDGLAVVVLGALGLVVVLAAINAIAGLLALVVP
jgi:hypothetical protein